MEPVFSVETDTEDNESDLTLEELKKVNELIEKLKDPSETLPEFYQQRHIALRFLRGKKFVVENAIKTMHQHLKVQEEIGPINISTVGNFLTQAIARTPPTSRDREGRKVVFLYGSRLPKHEGDFDRARMFCYLAENELLTSPQTQRLGITLCGNAEGMPLLANMAAAKNVVHTVTNAYPIRVGRILMMNPPWYFRVIFSAISLFMKPKIRDRVKLIKPEQLHEYIDLENVPNDFLPLGKLDFDFHAWALQQYKKAGVEPSESARANLDKLVEEKQTKSIK